ncbi:MAG: HAD family hydrolase [Proteobacteria bacterium]|nr:HAD family hydrolase [Pseudomonadota bacterium]
MKHISVIAFDLDDTLWPCMPVIKHAEATLYRWLEQHYPRISADFSAEDLIGLRQQFMKREQRFSIDLSLMRCELLKYLAVETGYDPEPLSRDGFEVFYQARQQVIFFDDVIPCLERLSRKFKLGSISNGNACVEKVGLGHLIEHAVSASEIKVAKPDSLIYQSLVERFSAEAHQVLYVGDDPLFDVAGSLEAGLQAIWINRENKPWPEHLTAPRHQISDLYELELLLEV